MHPQQGGRSPFPSVWGGLGVPAVGVTHASGRELVLGAGALLYYLPNGTRVTQAANEQVGPRHTVSPAVSPSCPCAPWGPQYGAGS